MKAQLLAAAAALAFAACGELKDKMQDRMADRALREAAVEQSLYAAEAYDVALADDDADGYLEDDETGVSGFSGPQVGPGMAPEALVAAAPGAPMPGNPDVEITLLRYDCGLAEQYCRPKSITASGDMKSRQGKVVGSVSASSSFAYYSMLTDAVAGGAGDKNTAVLARDSYVRAEFTVTREMTGRDGQTTTLTTTGHRVWSVKLGEWYVLDTAHETTGFPARDGDRPSITAATFARTFAAPDTTDTSGSSHRVLTFSNGATASSDRYAAFDPATGRLAGTWLNQGPGGFTGEGEFDVDLGGTPFCRLDDSGTIVIDRTFGDAVTSAVSEHVEITRDGAVTTIEGTLTLADGTTQTKTLTRTQIKPTGCEQAGAAREYTVEGTGYRGAEISLNVKRSPGSLVIDGERTLADGSVQTLHAVRTDGVLNIDGDMTDAQGRQLGSMHLVIHPDGNGQGQVTRTLANGDTLKRKIELVNGRPVIEDDKGNREELD